jgi:hypothetical protein
MKKVRLYKRKPLGVSKTSSAPGLPDGIFSNQKSPFGIIWEGLAVEDVGI